MSAEAAHEHPRQVRVHIDQRPYHSPTPTTGAALYILGRVEPGLTLYREVRGDQEDSEVKNDNAGPFHLRDDEHFHTGRGQTEVTIFVNGRRRSVAAGMLSYEQVVALAFDPVPTGPDIVFSVTYRRGPRANPEGDVSPGGTVELKNGMVFNVTPTNRS